MFGVGTKVTIIKNNDVDGSTGWALVEAPIKNKDLVGFKGVITEIFDGVRTDARLSTSDPVHCKVSTTYDGKDYPDFLNENNIAEYNFSFNKLQFDSAF